MKFNPFDWVVMAERVITFDTGRVAIRSSLPAAFYIEVDGYEVLAGSGLDLDYRLATPCKVRVDAPSKALLFAYKPFRQSYEPVGEVFSNPDRQPQESGTLLEVRKALRAFEVQQMQMKRELRNERAALQRARGERVASEGGQVAPAPDAAPAPVSEAPAASEGASE